VAAAALAAALSLLIGVGLPGAGAPAPARLGPGLSLAAQEQISATLGAEAPAYRLSAAPGGYRAASAPQGMRASFTAAGATVSAGATTVGLRLAALGWGGSLASVRPVAPAAHGNRASYERGAVTEWYANGPMGIEQGFTLASAPAGRAAWPLTLALALSGDARATLGAGGESILLSHAGSPALHYGGLVARDARGRVLPSWLSLRDGRLLVRVDARGARFPLRIDPFINQGPKLTGSGVPGGGGFGDGLALSADGNTALIGASGLGAAFVFTRSGGVWTQQQKLTGTGGGFDLLGWNVALSTDGNTAVLGSRSNENNVAPAFVFTRTGGVWTKQAELVGQSEKIESGYGAVAVSGDGNTVLVGEQADNFFAGSMFVFKRSGNVWTETQKINGAEVVGFGAFGFRVALSSDGKTALIGEPEDAFETGEAFIYTQSGGVFTKQQTLAAPGTVFAESIALSGDGDTAMVVNQPMLNQNKGRTFVYVRSGNTWTLEDEFEAPGEEAAAAVALNAKGDLAVVGATEGQPEGKAFVYARGAGGWAEEDELQSTGTFSKGFGVADALSSDGETALVGAPEDEGVGAAWPFAATKHASLGFFPQLEVPRAGPVYVPPNEPVELGGAWQIALPQGAISCPEVTLGGTLLGNGAKKDPLSIGQIRAGGGCTSTSPLGADVTLTAGPARGEPPYSGSLAINGKSQLAGNPDVLLSAAFTNANGALTSCTWETKKLTGTFSTVHEEPISIRSTGQRLKLVKTSSDAACPASGQLSTSEALDLTDAAGDHVPVFLDG
jgi:hypothetical protein